MGPLIVIPARFASGRYPGKPLVPLAGAGGQVRPLIRRTWDAACAVPGAGRVAIATDDERIAAAGRGFGAEVVMTPETCANGTERCAAAHAALGGGHEIVVNLQGDAPLTPPGFVEALIRALADTSGAESATPVLRCSDAALAALRADRAAGRVGATTAVTARDGSALYFSKEVLPFAGGDAAPVLHHVGIYAVRAGTLAAYPSWPAGPLERSEGLEQLRFLENGKRMLCVEVADPGHPFWELNNPGDAPRIEAALARMGRE